MKVKEDPLRPQMTQKAANNVLLKIDDSLSPSLKCYLLKLSTFGQFRRSFLVFPIDPTTTTTTSAHCFLKLLGGAR